jgi:hypothetical protein
MSELLLLQMFDYKVRREGNQEKKGGVYVWWKTIQHKVLKKRRADYDRPTAWKREEKYVWDVSFLKLGCVYRAIGNTARIVYIQYTKMVSACVYRRSLETWS